MPPKKDIALQFLKAVVFTAIFGVFFLYILSPLFLRGVSSELQGIVMTFILIVSLVIWPKHRE